MPRIIAIQVSVVAAFFDSFRRNAGTPLEIASTPVSATAPDEKPRSRMNRLSVPPDLPSGPCSAFAGLNGIGWMPPNQPNHVLREPEEHQRGEHDDVERTSGTRRARPDSLIPRRFASVMNTMITRHTATRCFASPSNCGIEMIAATPADTDTATVRM